MAHRLTSLRDPDVPVGDDRTVAFYDGDPEGYARGTLRNDLSALYPSFLDGVPAGGLLLDAGSGSGRDIREFLARGYRVESFDASAGMAALATRLTGVGVEVARFEDWKERPGRYDGIWCFASLLHVSKAELPAVLGRLARSLRPGAPIFASFKRGGREVVDDRGRRYTNLEVDGAERLFASIPGLRVSRVWQDDGPTALGGPTRWVYVLAVRDAVTGARTSA